jgi:hypothetical protein
VFVLVALLAACGSVEPAAEPAVAPHGLPSYFLALELESRMSQTFELVWLRASVDGAPVAEAGDPERSETSEVLAAPRCLHRAMVQAGTHELALELRFRGRGYGVFSYLRGYQFLARTAESVTIPDGSFGVAVVATAWEQSDVPLENRPQIRWDVEVHRDTPAAGCDPRLSGAEVDRGDLHAREGVVERDLAAIGAGGAGDHHQR